MTFALNFAPHLGLTCTTDGLFVGSAGADPVAQIRLAYDLGFRAIEDNFFQLRSVEKQRSIGRTIQSLGMTMGCIVSTLVHDRPTFALDPADIVDQLCTELRCSIEAAKRTGGRYLTVIAGRTCPVQSRDRQRDNAIRNIGELGEIAERENVVLLVEAISRKRWPDVFVSNVSDAHDICSAVGSRAVKVLFDIYQCQRESGDLIASRSVLDSDRVYSDRGQSGTLRTRHR